MFQPSFLLTVKRWIEFLRNVQGLPDSPVCHCILPVLRVGDKVVNCGLREIVTAAPEFGAKRQNDPAHGQKFCHHGPNDRIDMERSKQFKPAPFTYSEALGLCSSPD